MKYHKNSKMRLKEVEISRKFIHYGGYLFRISRVDFGYNKAGDKVILMSAFVTRAVKGFDFPLISLN